MKFIVSTLTVHHICSAIDEFNELGDVKATPASAQLLDAVNKVNRLENFSVSSVHHGDFHTDTVVEINDEVVIRFLKLYMKTARLVAPVVKAAVSLFSSISTLIQGDCDDLVNFIKRRK